MKDKTYTIAFAFTSIGNLAEAINDFLGKDNVEYVDLKYAIENNGNYNIYIVLF